MNNLDDTIKLAKEFEAIGISAIAIHGRKKNERPQHANNAGLYDRFLDFYKIINTIVCTDAIRKIAENLTIPVIANGGSREIEKYADILKFRQMCGTTSVMIARAAEWNVTIFRKNGLFFSFEFI